MNPNRSNHRSKLIATVATLILAAAINLIPKRTPSTIQTQPEKIAISATPSSPSHSLPTRAASRSSKLGKSSATLTDTQLDSIFSSAPGQVITIALPDGQQASGTVTTESLNEGDFVQGRLTKPQPGFFFFQKQSMPGVAGDIVGVIRFDEGQLAYRVDPSPSGGSVLALHHVDDVFCAQLAIPPAPPEEVARPEEHPDNLGIPGYQNGIISLQSLPGATGVIYLDYDGETGPHAGWGDFDAAAPNRSNAEIRAVWERVAEDFAPFNLNVTTDLQVYLNAPENSRQRCIVTPTTDAAANAGGVAYIGSFNWTGDTPCWAFYSSGKSAAEVISHEIGHTLKLSHDGRTNPAEGYYGGHGSGDVGWAPIMGVGYSKNLTQWSRGEYLNSNQTQDDLLKIVSENNSVSYRVDDHGATANAASYLNIKTDDSVDCDGVISSSEDIDAFAFTLTAPSSVTLTASPLAAGPNLDIYAEIRDASDNIVASDNPETGLSSTITASLPAGDYLFRVSGTGKGIALEDGYSDYGSLGFYKLTGSVPNSELPDRFSITENCAIDDLIGTVSPRFDHSGNPISFSIISGNNSGMFNIDPISGDITVADADQFDFETWTSGYESPEFELVVEITDSVDSLADETIRVVVSLDNENEAPSLDTESSITLLSISDIGMHVITMSGSDPDYGDVLTYSIIDGDSNGTFSIDPGTGEITVVGSIQEETTLTIEATDTGSLTATFDLEIVLIEVVGDYIAGSIRQTYFEGISGSSIANLTSHPNFPDSPNSEKLLYELSTGSHGDAFGSTIRGYIFPPNEGAYTFWLASDDAGELWLSTNEDPANAQLITTVSGYTDPLTWNNPSAEIELLAGEPYYIEVRYKEGGGGDHASVAWESEFVSQEVIPGRFLAPYKQNYAPKVTPASFTVRANSFPSTIVGSVTVTDVNQQDTFSQFSIVSGNNNGIFAINPDTGIISIANYGLLTVDQVYSLGVGVMDSASPQLQGTGTISVTAINPYSNAIDGIVQEFWDGINGNELSTLTSDSRYPLNPSNTRVLQSFDTGSDFSNNYGSRIRALVTPPTNGTYTFYLSSDDQSQLLLSTTNTPENATQIASISGWAGKGQWDKYPSQMSAPVNLIGGQAYYIETLHKEGSGGDHVQVAWTGPDITEITVIDSTKLQTYDPNTAPVWNSLHYIFSVDVSATTGHSVGTVSASDSESVKYAILSGNQSGAFAINPTTGQITIAQPSALVVGRTNLLVGAQDSGLNGLYPLQVSSTSVAITVTSGGNRAPNALPSFVTLPSYSSVGTIVTTVFVIDQNPGESLTFSINTSAPFNINPSTGRITLNSPLDPNGPQGYSFPYTVIDAGGLSASSSVTINITTPYDGDNDGIPDTWENLHFGGIFTTGPNDDPDGDQLSNLAELAFASNPTISGGDGEEITTFEPDPSSTSGAMLLSYRRPINFATMGLSYEIMAASTLGDWAPASFTPVSTAPHADGVSEWITVRITPPTGSRFFTNVVATQDLGGGGDTGG